MEGTARRPRHAPGVRGVGPKGGPCRVGVAGKRGMATRQLEGAGGLRGDEGEGGGTHHSRGAALRPTCLSLYCVYVWACMPCKKRRTRGGVCARTGVHECAWESDALCHAHACQN